jgi:predicted SprT family Zn-dependent metalloprotease
MMTKMTVVRDTLKMKAVGSFETPMHFYQATGHYVPRENDFQKIVSAVNQAPVAQPVKKRNVRKKV